MQNDVGNVVSDDDGMKNIMIEVYGEAFKCRK